MDNEQKIQEILSEAITKLAAIDDNAAHQVRASLLVTKGAITIGHLPNLSFVIARFAQDQIDLIKSEIDN